MIEATKKENLVPTLAKDESLQREEKPLFFSTTATSQRLIKGSPGLATVSHRLDE